jgi:hypothetical protein
MNKMDMEAAMLFSYPVDLEIDEDGRVLASGANRGEALVEAA